MKVTCRSIERDISYYLDNDWAVGRDKSSMVKWEEGEITLDELIGEIKEHNRMPESVRIDRHDFVKWLRGLGYARNMPFQFYLYRSGSPVTRDNAMITKWSLGEISTKELIEWIVFDNDIPKNILITERQMEAWLKTLGWRRKK